ncbi:MAG: chalcone isomerase family protein [Pseudomonadota bacterium]
MRKCVAMLIVTMVIMMSGVPISASATVPAASLPPEIQALGKDWQMQGSARFRKYLVNVYDGRLWTPAGRYDPQGLYALDLTYALAFKAKDLAARSVQEMQRIGEVDGDRLTQWGEVMRRAFPDIKAGDRLIGVNLPGRETRFYLNGKLFSTVPDPAFGPAFFGIWLDPRTSEPDFRRELLKPTNS